MTNTARREALDNLVAVIRDEKGALGPCRALIAILDREMTATYPRLCGWLIPMPTSRKRRAAWAKRAVAFAASRISEAYGIGRGSEWLGQQFDASAALAGKTVDSLAAGQVLASLRAIGVAA